MEAAEVVLHKFNLEKVLVPGNGHCFWLAIMLAYNNCRLQNYPHLTETEEANLFELKRSFQELIAERFQYDVRDRHIPLLTDLITDLPDPITSDQRKKCVEQYLTMISETESETTIPPPFWGSMALLDLISNLLRKPIYLVKATNDGKTVTLEKYSDISESAPAKITTIDLNNWESELNSNTDGAVVIGHKHSNYFYAYNHGNKIHQDSRIKSNNKQKKDRSIRYIIHIRRIRHRRSTNN